MALQIEEFHNVTHAPMYIGNWLTFGSFIGRTSMFFNTFNIRSIHGLIACIWMLPRIYANLYSMIIDAYNTNVGLSQDIGIYIMSVKYSKV